MEAEDGVRPDEVPTASDVEEAARLANAHDFIMALPQAYDTVSHAHATALLPVLHHDGLGCDPANQCLSHSSIV